MIEVQNVSLTRGDKLVFRNYTFAIQRGNCLGIMGVNGVGKSTLLLAMLGILPTAKGTVRVEGSLAYVPQLFDIPFSYSVMDIVIMGRARNIGLFSSPSLKDYKIAHESIALMGIEHLAERPFGNLSGGQRQMVLIAQALSSQCDVMLLDEPCSALDYSNQALVLSRLKYLNEELGMTIVYATHIPQHACVFSSHVLLMRGGDDYQYGTTQAVLNEAQLTAMYHTEIGTATFANQTPVLAPRFDKTVNCKK